MEETLQKMVESPARDENVGFDLRTEIRDAKTGKLIRFQPYNRHVHRDHGVVYERGGKLFYENGQDVPETVGVHFGMKKTEEEPKVQPQVQPATGGKPQVAQR